MMSLLGDTSERVAGGIGEAPAGWSDLTSLEGRHYGLPALPKGPFVLLDDARGGCESFLFSNPREIICAKTAQDVRSAIGRARNALCRGHYLAGYVTYEAGQSFEPLSAESAAVSTKPLLWLGVFDRPDVITDIGNLLPPVADEHLTLVPNWTKAQYCRAVEIVKQYIRAGDIYQANLTFPAAVRWRSPPLAHYRRLRGAQCGGWSGIVSNAGSQLLSFSPELFTALVDGRIWAKPMKGTALRSGNVCDDAGIASLRDSEKDRAENLMIVDLLRNDISRVAIAGSVEVPRLFEIETYPTLFQMTSTITALLKQEYDVCDLLMATFPCGSITGAPKRRAREIIQEVEGSARGIYTGAIGYISPDHQSAFNVAIRTLASTPGSDEAVLGLGAAITDGSMAESEWEECLGKGRFLSIGNGRHAENSTP